MVSLHTSTEDFATESVENTLANHHHYIVLFGRHHDVVGEKLSKEEQRQGRHHEDGRNTKGERIAVISTHALYILAKNGRNERRDETACVDGNVEEAKELLQLDRLLWLELIATECRHAWFDSAGAKGN